ncbi:Fis family transcriptional regulator [Clostridiales bacterium PH28_bin88]|nr:Fis family transcriptional regulator [Clostridiales bacterium PH28_bin88]
MARPDVDDLERHILDAIHNGIVAIDHNGIITVFNKTMERIYGYSAQQAIGRHIRDIVPYTGLLKVVETGKPHIGRKFRIDNTVYLANRTPIIDNSKVIGAVGVIQDITEFQSVVDELQIVKELKSTMETILESAYDGLIVVNSEGMVTMVNGAFAALLGTRAELVVGKHVTDVIDDTRMHIVAQTGRAEKGDLQRINGHDVVVMRIPVKKEGRTIGAVGKIMFKDVEELNALAQKVNALHSELDYYRDEVRRYRGAKYGLENIIGDSDAMAKLKETARRVAQSSSTVLIRGETGTGKELIAHALHMESSRRFGPFIKVNCAAIPENLLESELFGYEEGAFTGAKKGGQVGKFELADRGSIFLDEIGDLSMALQAKLLRVLQEKEIERLGGSKTRKVDVRVIAATNKNLEDLIRRNKFREDLFYRLNVVNLNIPPLRERREDLPALVQHFISKYNQEFGLKVTGLAPAPWNLFRTYHWPGNVRELENVIERAFNVVEGNVILVQDLPAYLSKFTHSGKILAKQQTLHSLLEQTEKAAIKEALSITQGNKVQAARLLGISRAWIYQKITKYHLEE